MQQTLYSVCWEVHLPISYCSSQSFIVCGIDLDLLCTPVVEYKVFQLSHGAMVTRIVVKSLLNSVTVMIH